MQYKITFRGMIQAIQPRSNVWRYRLDNRTHTTTGFNLFLLGTVDDSEEIQSPEGAERQFSIAISGLQQEKHHFQIGDTITGTAWTEKYPQCEYADYYRAGALKKRKAAKAAQSRNAPPWTEAPPTLDIYDRRGCRMLDKRRWGSKCFSCKWAAMANVAIEYEWGVHQKYRFESFCYGPKSCTFYKMGKPRAVPYKDCGTCYDDGCLDEICTESRSQDE